MMPGTRTPIEPVLPESVRIAGTNPTGRLLHQDRRGFLVELLRADDANLRGERFAMAYSSVTVPGEFRDRDRWHFHSIQSDRFAVPLGEMTLALYDARPGSDTHGELEVVRLEGAPFDSPASDSVRDVATSMLEVPPGVYHSLGNLSNHSFVVVNFPTERYSASDEGRVPFADVVVAARGGPFSWDDVARRPSVLKETPK
jgi:dTDP-4-dehydrorhamnose 3,5-epimerase-like enzyme